MTNCMIFFEPPIRIYMAMICWYLLRNYAKIQTILKLPDQNNINIIKKKRTIFRKFIIILLFESQILFKKIFPE